MLIVLAVELEILRDMQALDRDVFYYLAQRIDFMTGIVGRSCRVSYGGMALDLSERQAERRRVEVLRTLTSKQIENSIARLVSAGLLERLSESGRNKMLVLSRIFWVDFVGKGNCDKKADGRLLGDQLGELKKLFVNHFNRLEDKNKTSWETNCRPDGTTSFTLHTTYRDGEFSLTPDWKPDPNEFEVMLSASGYSSKNIDPLWITEFVSYWSLEKNSGRRYTQSGWTRRLALAMIDYLRNPGLWDQRRGISKSGSTHQRSITTGLPEWAVPPKDNNELCRWMRAQGYGDGPPGLQLFQTREWLRNVIESRLKSWRSQQ